MRVWLGLLAVSVTMVVVGALLFWRGHGHSRDDGNDGGFRVSTRLPVQTETTFDWQGVVPKGQSLFLRDQSGDITVTAATGTQAEVHAVKTWQSGDPSAVQVLAVPGDSGATVCALWRGRTGDCGANGHYNIHGISNKSDVQVNLTVKLPKGVRLDVVGTNGTIKVTGAAADMRLITVNGEIDAATSTGGVNAVTVNGNVHASTRTLPPGSEVKIVTVNGSVTIELPIKLDADINAKAVSGGVQSEYPVAVSSGMLGKHIEGRVGAGGVPISVTTVNGSIELKKVPVSTK
ncbi:MAG TPA: DUF4097 family beta strand repeat-containing protein [Gemmatimonadales bacterium]